MQIEFIEQIIMKIRSVVLINMQIRQIDFMIWLFLATQLKSSELKDART